jgi:hypothetical protein
MVAPKTSGVRGNGHARAKSRRCAAALSRSTWPASKPGGFEGLLARAQPSPHDPPVADRPHAVVDQFDLGPLARPRPLVATTEITAPPASILSLRSSSMLPQASCRSRARARLPACPWQTPVQSAAQAGATEIELDLRVIEGEDGRAVVAGRGGVDPAHDLDVVLLSSYPSPPVPSHRPAPRSHSDH